MLSRSALESRIDEGLELLDDIEPGWAWQVNWDSLDISSPSRCILGQVFGSYQEGKEALGLDGTGALYGFDVHGSQSMDENYDLLTSLWKEIGQEYTRKPAN